MMRFTCTIAAIFLSASAIFAQEIKPTESPTIDIVFCIDRSGSMSQVIETAKIKVWAIVNEVARAKPTPVLRIGLIGYGNANNPLQVTPLTSDLDEVYKHLMTYTDNASMGAEYVGTMIQKATTDIQWSAGNKTLKIIYVVGNETAKQGDIDYTTSAPQAIAKGIVVNAIYCGDYDKDTVSSTWREFAKLADGQYMEIASDGGAIVVNTPYDAQLAELSAKLNTTYLGYGVKAQYHMENQAMQDGNAQALGAAPAADRAAAKSGAMYQNSSWDLVDASKQDSFNLSAIPEEQLPEELRKLTPDQRKAAIEAKSKERAELQNQIQEISVKRSDYIQKEVADNGLTADKAFDAAVQKTIVEQGRAKGFEFEEK